MVKKLMMLCVATMAAMGAWAAFQCEVQVPAGDIGVSRTATVTYSNNGASAIAAPYVRIEAGDNAYVRFSESDAWSKSVEFLATSGQTPASSLRAGEEIKLPVFVYTATQHAQVTFSYTQSSTEAFPWSDIGASLKPSYVSDSAWTFSLATLKSRFGTTWNSYLSRLRANADYLAENGRPVRRLDRLLQIEINRALGVDAVLPVLASVTDAARSARGMGLSFTRSYSSAMYGRFTSGILGYGWTDNLSTCAELSSDGKTLVFRVPGGGSYSFTKATGSWKPEDSRDKTVLAESSSAYTLTYQSGTVQTFAKSNMRTSSIADNSGNTLTFTWNGTTLQKLAHTDGQTLTFAYSGGRISSVTDDCGRKTAYTYSNSLLTKVTAPDGLETRYEYRSSDGTAAARALSRIVYPDGTTREFSYDTSSGLVSAISSNGGKERTTLSRDGGVAVLTGPDGAKTTVKTGVSGETLETADALGGVSAKGYTEDGLLKSVVSPSGLTGAISHDALGRVSKSVSAAGTATAFAYEETFGNLKTVTDAKNHAVTYGYDAKGRGTSVTFADGSASKLEYNSRGDVVKSTNRRGQTVTYTYDAKGLVTKKTWSNGRTFTYAYDAHGNVTTATDSETGTVTMQYDSADRLTKIVYPAGRGFMFAYDSCGRLAVRTSLDGAVEKFAYDASGRLASVSDGNGVTYLQNTYDATTGQLAKQTNGNGTSVSYLYDKLGRVVSIEHCAADGKIVESLQYCYDADGRCIRASSLLGEERYEYDKDGQLTSVRYPDSPSEAFAYDAVGNRITANGATYIVNSLNQYTSVSGGGQSSSTAITYDKDGNMTSLTDAKGTTTNTYDTLNRLVAVTNTAAGIRWSCRYDVFGNRVSVTDNGVTTERTYLQGSLPSVAAEYVNGQLKERHIVVGAVRVADLTSNNSASTAKYYHADLIGSTRLVTDGDGSVVDRRAYKAFGETRVGNETTSSAGYVGTLGVETDPTGLLFMRNRYYSPALGRFIQMDPIELNGGDVQLYSYCANVPTKNIDPNGLAYQTCETLWEKNDDYKRNGNYPRTEFDAVRQGWIRLSAWESQYHGILRHKYVSPDFTGEVVFRAWDGSLETADEYMGTPNNYNNGHFKTDVMPYWMCGNTRDDKTPLGSRILNLPTFIFNQVADWGEKVAAWMGYDWQEQVRISPAGGSASINPDKIDDFELPDDFTKGVTISGSFTISFEWVIQINPELEYPSIFGYAYFYVDGVSQGGGGTYYADKNGLIRFSKSVNVTGEEIHSLRWNIELLTSLPVSYSVKNIKIVRSAKKSVASAKTTVASIPQDSDQKAVALSAKVLSATPGVALARNRISTQSTKTASVKLLTSADNGVTSPRLYCYERYVAVKGLAYAFALSADDDATISVSGLPSGFSFSDGVISGTASAAGTTAMTITASGSSGTTTKHVQFDVIEATEDFQPIISLMSHPDLRPYMASGWSAPLVVSTSADSTYGATTFLDTDPLYVSWLMDCGNANAEGTFYTCLYVDEEPKYAWEHSDGLPRDYYANVIGHSLGTLSAGTHTVRIVTDATGAVAESNESNNSFETTITVLRDWFPNLSVSSLSISRTSIAISDSVTVHWRVENNDNGAADKSKIAFLTYKYDDTTENYTLVKTEWIDCLPLAAGGSQEFKKTITGKTLGEGAYSFVVIADGQENIVERDETDNISAVAVLIGKDSATSSKSTVDWQFNKIKGEADSFFLSASSDMKKKATTFKVGQPIYMRCCWWNAKRGAVSGNAMRVRVVMNGASGVYTDRSYFEKDYYYYFSNRTPDFLQNLPAGNYTLTAVLDSENTWVESNEKNNVKTISFTVIGTPKIFCEAIYHCALNEPVSWLVTIDGKATLTGLPSGLKYSGGAITGKATKTGTYTVSISTKNEAGTATKSITIQVENPGFIVSCSAQPNGSSIASNVVSGGTVEMYAGVNQVIMLSSIPGKADVASADATVTAKGLPAGLKLSGGKITGVPTKAGTYAVNVSFKNKLSWTSSFLLNIVVHPLPAWAVGNFEGFVSLDENDGGFATMSITAAGKISGKIAYGGTNWTFKADSFAIASETVGYTNLALRTVATSGKATLDLSLNMVDFLVDSLPSSTTSFAEGYLGEVYTMMYRLPWKDKNDTDAASLIASYAGEYSCSVPYGDDSGDVTFVLDEKGVVKGTVILPDGAKTRKATFSCNVLPNYDSLSVVIALPPDAKKGYPAVFKVVNLVNHSGEGADDLAFRDPGVAAAVSELTAESGATGTVSVNPKYGQVAPGKDVTLTAKAAKGSVFHRWEITGVDTEGLDLSSSTLKIKMTDTGDVFAKAVFVTAEEDAASIALSVDALGGEISSEAIISVTNTCGVALKWSVAADALSKPTVAVSGLPAGLKFTAKDIMKKGSKTEVDIPANTIYGAPTAESKLDAKTGLRKPSAVKFTVTTAGKSKRVYSVDMTILPLPDWAVGNFEGFVRYDENDGGFATMNITAAGKVSGKIAYGGTNWTFKADSYDITSETVGYTNFAVKAVAASGKATLDFSLAITKDGVDYLPDSAVAFGDGNFGDMPAEMHRLPWKDKDDAKSAALIASYAGAYSCTVPYGDSTGDVTFVLDEKGAVKGTVMLPDGDKTRKTTFSSNALTGDKSLSVVIALPSDFKKGYPAVFKIVELVNCSGEGSDGMAYRDPGVIVNVDEYFTGFGATGTVSVSPKYGQVSSGKSVTITAKPAKGSVFHCWKIKGVGTDGLNLTEPTLKFVMSGESDVYATAVFATVEDDIVSFSLDVPPSRMVEPGGMFLINLTDYVNSLSRPQVTVKGLPSGLKYDPKTMTISGSITKNGKYTVMLTGTNASVTGKNAIVGEFVIIVQESEVDTKYTSISDFEWVYTSCGVEITSYLGDDYNVNIPPIIDNLPVVSIGEWSFFGCASLASVHIPDSVTSIGVGAFDDCLYLESINIPKGVSVIEGCLFSKCHSLKRIVIPEGVTSIGESAFYHCNSLTELVIPNSVTNIDSGAFANCSSLTNVTKIGNATIRVGSSVFYGCPGLIDSDGFVIAMGVVCEYFGEGGDIVIPDGVESIAEGAFNGCSSLRSIRIPDSVVSIGEFAFWGCSGLADDDGFVIVKNVLFGYFGAGGDVLIPQGVTRIGAEAFPSEEYGNIEIINSITIPDSVVSIGEGAFESCSSLRSINIPDSVISIEWGAFARCSSLVEVFFEGDAPVLEDSVFYDVNENCTAYVRPGSIGWGVTIPGVWNNIYITYEALR